MWLMFILRGITKACLGYEAWGIMIAMRLVVFSCCKFLHDLQFALFWLSSELVKAETMSQFPKLKFFPSVCCNHAPYICFAAYDKTSCESFCHFTRTIANFQISAS